MLLCLSLLITAARAIVVSGPSGPWSIAHEVVQLTDESRWDPYAPENSQHKRRILTSFFLPTHRGNETCEVSRIDYLPPRTLEAYGNVAIGLGLPSAALQGFELEFCKETRDDQQQQYPVIIFSPGFSNSRLLSSAQAQSLASLGNIVITVDHPYDATVVEFPDGTAVYGFTADEANDERGEEAVKVRSQDISFLIDQLLEPGHLPDGLETYLDTSKIFVFGHSLGGATSAQVAFNDDRIVGGLNFDGKLFGSAAESGLDLPFFLIGAEAPANQTSYFGGFLDKLRGPKMLLTVDGMKHLSFTDIPLLLSLRDDIPPELEPVIAAVFGSINGWRAATVVNGILKAVTGFLFRGEEQDICHFEDDTAEIVVVEEGLGGVCHD